MYTRELLGPDSLPYGTIRAIGVPWSVTMISPPSRTSARCRLSPSRNSRTPIRALTGAAADIPHDSGELCRLLAGPSHDELTERLGRARADGDVRPDADLAAAADALLGAVLYRVLAQDDNSDAATDCLLRVVLHGIRDASAPE